MSRTWKKPELIVLYKGRPDENLLGRAYCKAMVPKNLPDRASSGGICIDNRSVPCNISQAS